jgi:hypothetical protein
MRNKREEHTIGEIADILGRGTPSTKNPSNLGGDIPWLTPKDLAGLHNRYVARGNMSIKSTRSRVMSINCYFVDTFTIHVDAMDTNKNVAFPNE